MQSTIFETAAWIRLKGVGKNWPLPGKNILLIEQKNPCFAYKNAHTYDTVPFAAAAFDPSTARLGGPLALHERWPCTLGRDEDQRLVTIFPAANVSQYVIINISTITNERDSGATTAESHLQTKPFSSLLGVGIFPFLKPLQQKYQQQKKQGQLRYQQLHHRKYGTQLHLGCTSTSMVLISAAKPATRVLVGRGVDGEERLDPQLAPLRTVGYSSGTLRPSILNSMNMANTEGQPVASLDLDHGKFWKNNKEWKGGKAPQSRRHHQQTANSNKKKRE